MVLYVWILIYVFLIDKYGEKYIMYGLFVDRIGYVCVFMNVMEWVLNN